MAQAIVFLVQIYFVAGTTVDEGGCLPDRLWLNCCATNKNDEGAARRNLRLAAPRTVDQINRGTNLVMRDR